MIRQNSVCLNRLSFQPNTSDKVNAPNRRETQVMTATDSSYPTDWAVVNEHRGSTDLRFLDFRPEKSTACQARKAPRSHVTDARREARRCVGQSYRRRVGQQVDGHAGFKSSRPD